MTTPAIKVVGLWKEYVVGRSREHHATFYDLLAHTLGAPLRRLRNLGGHAEEEERFWALRDVNFEVQAGEVVGIIGRNGAGKSTLLKILSRITAPSRGRIEIHGRLASLLEVGTGFHPELSGRENIFLNGAILGMSRQEVARKFDEIVGFAEIAQFIDTPVKRYSSGMYVRLAFAVAAHLDTDVLLVDEVMAVGDAAFQKRCLGKMRDVAGSGRTVLFVSHNMVAMQALCSRGIYLSGGSVALDVPAHKAIAAYLEDASQATRRPLTERTDRIGDGRLRFLDYWIENKAGERVSSASLGRTNVVCLAYRSQADLEQVYVAFDIRETSGESVTNCNTADVGEDFARIPAGDGVFRCRLPRFPIRGGRYTGNIYCSARGEVTDFIQSAIQIDVEDADFYGTGSLRNTCRVQLDQRWSFSPIADAN